MHAISVFFASEKVEMMLEKLEKKDKVMLVAGGFYCHDDVRGHVLACKFVIQWTLSIRTPSLMNFHLKN